LLDLVRAHLNKAIDLTTIAQADRGSDAEDTFAELEQIVASGDVPDSSLQAQEALELTRWSRPDQPDWKPGRFGLHGHVQRAFACATLLRWPRRRDCEEPQTTLAPLIESCIELGPEYVRRAAQFVAHELPAIESRVADGDYEAVLDRAFHALAFTLLICHETQEFERDQRDARVPDLREAARYLAACGDAAMAQKSGPDRVSTWLLGASWSDTNIDIWRSLARRILVERSDALPEGARDDLQLIGAMLTAPTMAESED